MNDNRKEDFGGFRGLVERSPLGIYRTTPEGEHLLANQAILDLAGYASLKSFGHRVLLAENGTTTMAVIADSEVPIDLMISDLVMPGMSGSDLARRARAARPDLPIVIMSGCAPGDLSDEVDALRVPFLEKPFTLASLGRKLQEVLLS